MHVTPCVLAGVLFVAGSGNQRMRKHISEMITGELVRMGYTFRIGCGADITVFSGDAGEDSPANGLRIATIQMDTGTHTARVWVSPAASDDPLMIAGIIDRAVHPDGWRVCRVMSFEETAQEALYPDLPAGIVDSEAGNAAGRIARRRFRVFRFLVLTILSFVVAFLGMVVNLTTAGWIGVAASLSLIGVFSGKASAKGCMTTLAVWLTGLLCLLAVFTLAARI